MDQPGHSALKRDLNSEKKHDYRVPIRPNSGGNLTRGLSGRLNAKIE